MLAKEIRKISMPIIIAANKCDIAPKENIQKLSNLKDYTVVPVSAESELALRRADKTGLIKYLPGDNIFEIIQKEKLTDKQLKAIEKIRTVMNEFNCTGVQKCIEKAVFNVLDMIAVYPVEDENKLCDKDGNILPDAYLMKRGSNALNLAYKVHTELGDKFIRGINAKTHRIIGSDYQLQNGDVIKIVADV